MNRLRIQLLCACRCWSIPAFVIALFGLAQLACSQAAWADDSVDPTRPPDSVRARLADTVANDAIVLTLHGVQRNGQHSVAMINDTWLRLGQQIQGYTLVAVTARSAVLRDAEQHRTELLLDLPVYQTRKPDVRAAKNQPHTNKTSPALNVRR